VTLRFYYHPLSSFCQKVLVALYENDVKFEPVLLRFGDETAAAELRKLWPIARIPVLHDVARGQIVPESSIQIEYLAQHYPGKTALVPADPDRAREVRFLDRFFDLYVDVPMQRVVGDRLRPAGQRDPLGVEQARALLRTAYDVLERELHGKTWAAGDAFTMADCAAAPALYFANRVEPYQKSHPAVAAYWQRLLARPSYARAFRESEPHLGNFPLE
jgi:glutathione S-transferase